MKKKNAKQQSWSPVPTHDAQGNPLSKADRKRWREIQKLVGFITAASAELQANGKNIS